MAQAVITDLSASAQLSSTGVSTATLATANVGGFGLDFGMSFGEVAAVGPGTATITTPPSTAVLASNGTSTATLAPVAAVAELQLV